MTSQESFEGLKFWLADIGKNAPVEAIRVLLGLKSDLSYDRVIDYDTAQAFAVQHNMKYFECSAKEGDNIEEAF